MPTNGRVPFEQTVLAAANEGRDWTCAEVCRALGICPAALTVALRSLRDRGLLFTEEEEWPCSS